LQFGRQDSNLGGISDIIVRYVRRYLEVSEPFGVMNLIGRLNRVRAAGILILLFLLAYNPITHDNLLSPSRPLNLYESVAMWLFDLLLFVLAFLSLLLGGRWRMRELAFTAVAAIGAVILTEAGLRAIAFASTTLKPPVIDRRMKLSPYAGKKWARAYFRELKSLKFTYEPYTGWRRKELRGRFINIDEEGRRRTWNPTVPEGERPPTVAVFGGSTVWGTGARDEFTIPSYLSKILNKGESRYVVQNYGESGYTFTQEVIKLAMLIKDEKMPDYAIFYDGANEIYSAYASGKAGTQYLHEIMKKKLEKKTYPCTLKKALKRLIITSMTVTQTAKLFTIAKPKLQFPEKGAKLSHEELQKLGDDIISNYMKTMGILKALAKEYPFRYLCFWQPVIFEKKSLTAEESLSDIRISDKSLKKLYRYVNDKMAAATIPHFYCISDIFSEKKETFFIDFCHLTEKGNRTSAAAIAAAFQAESLR